MGDPVVVGYSERGMVNELIFYLRTNPGETIKFLETIEWNGDKSWDSIKTELQKKATRFQWIMEPGFAQFGDPDIILVCHTKANPSCPYIFFIEAKIITYEKSAKINSGGMKQRGYNSSINGQLSLRYRLSQALGGYKPSTKVLKESKSVWRYYKNSVLGETSVAERKLEKAQNLKFMLPLLYFNGSSPKERREHCFFIALTSDTKSPFNGKDTNEGNDKAPLYLSGTGKNDNKAWKRTGWCGWFELAKNFGSKYKNSLEYRATFRLAINADNSSILKRLDRSKRPFLGKCDANLMTDIEGFLENSYTGFKGCLNPKYSKGKSSDSVKLNGLVCIKILHPVPGENKKAVLGLAADLSPDIGKPFEYSFEIKGRSFVGFPVGRKKDIEGQKDLSTALASYLEDLSYGKQS